MVISLGIRRSCCFEWHLYTNGNPLTIENLFIDGLASRLYAESSELNCSGSMDIGLKEQFVAGTSTVTFTGGIVHEINTNTTFYAMRCLASGATLQFEFGTTTYVTHMVDLKI